MTLADQQAARTHLSLALLALEAGQHEVARTHLSRSLELRPEDAEARLVQARFEVQNNRPTQALSALDARDLYHPDRRSDPAAAFCRAQVLVRCGQQDVAIELLEQLVGEYECDPRPRQMLAAVCMQQGRREDATGHLEVALRLDPDNAAVRDALVEILADRDPQRAVKVLLGDRRDRQVPSTMLRAARLCHSAGRLRDAEEQYRALLDLVDEDAAVWFEAGRVARDLGDLPLAAERLERAVTLTNGRDVEALVELARAQMLDARFTQARQTWRRVRRPRPNDPRPWAAAAVLAAVADEARLAHRATRGLADRADEALRRQLVAEFSALVDGAAHIAEIDAVTDGAPSRSAPQEVSLEALLDHAVNVLRKHEQAHPHRADTHYHLGVCLHRLGQTTESEASVRQALQINPRYADAKRLSEVQAGQRAAA